MTNTSHNSAQIFGSRLKDAMAAQNIKQVDLIAQANALGEKLGKSQISQYVSGKTIPRKDTLALLARILGVDSCWLMGESGDESNHGSEKDLHQDNSLTQTSNNHSSLVDRALSENDGLPKVSSTSKGSSMREFKKSSKLDNVLYDVRGPVVDEAARMEAEGTRILKLNIGNPAPFGFSTPDEVIYDMRQQLVDCQGYSDAKGMFGARKAIMQYAQIKHIPNVTMDGIYTGNGVSELINICMSALLDNGDEILIPSPDYPLWTACATLAGGNVVHYMCDEQAEWYPDIDDIKKKITPRTKAIVIINPNNPTGALYPREVLQ